MRLPLLIFLAALATPARAEPQQRTDHLFLLRIEGGSADDINYLAYHAASGDRSRYLVQRSHGILFEDQRAEIAASDCPGLREAIEDLERTPWPSIRIAHGPSLPYLDPAQYVAYTFYGTIGYRDAISWESQLYVVDVHGEPKPPFAAWAGRLVRLVDACLARRD